MKRITEWTLCGKEAVGGWLIGRNGDGRHIMTSRIEEVTGRLQCRTKSGSEYLLVGSCARPDVQKLRGDDPANPLGWNK